MKRVTVLDLLLELFDPTTIAVLAINGMVLMAFLVFLWFLGTV